MEHDLQNTIALLANTPAAFNALLRNLPETWTEHNEGENTWTAYGVIGHLIYCERTNWIPRAKWLLEFGENRPFEPFARLTPSGGPIGEQLDEFARLRSANIAELRAMRLGPQDLERRGQHPTFGAVTLSQLLATWAVHDMTHLHQTSRILAHQYREAVGPWNSFLGVLHCDGHSVTG
jgi:hypothetical protein